MFLSSTWPAAGQSLGYCNAGAGPRGMMRSPWPYSKIPAATAAAEAQAFLNTTTPDQLLKLAPENPDE